MKFKVKKVILLRVNANPSWACRFFSCKFKICVSFVCWKTFTLQCCLLFQKNSLKKLLDDSSEFFENLTFVKFSGGFSTAFFLVKFIMRSPSIFQDFKFLHKPKTQVSSFLGSSGCSNSLQSNFSGEIIEISNQKNNSLFRFDGFSFQGKGPELHQIFLVFSSFESKDLDCALNLFKRFTLTLASQYKTTHCFQTYQKLLYPLCHLAKQKKQVSVNKPKLSNPTFAFDTTSHRFYLRKASSVLSTVETLKITTPKTVGLLRALRAICQPSHPQIVPQSSALITVIKSPHVFKKTREQFALTKCKSVVKLDFKNSSVASLFLNSFFLLKFPCEIKVILKTI